ncbi:flagellar hook-basal body complex protein FliE [Xanthobacter agilis]|jgi:flagellar hook-basal body complex protein FliE|uniref:Flagellar hook-basal body complex protein FliE n=1 Tax=Xanthobacter agilis TaxID=47492 RepID=A0ABU0LHU6_XANAG|nr:flagellar hook-basal body complex protein FliE [Xanthobacter agilis]MDQ0506668.1 flagellar hook-basal body complex protein FliE [Xanthobacter agilis]
MISSVNFSTSSTSTGGVSLSRSNTQMETAATGGAQGTSGVDGTDFSTMLARMSSDTVDTLKTSEATSIMGINGRASVQQVVEAVMNAEQSLQTAISVRDKVVAAYQEISRMTI